MSNFKFLIGFLLGALIIGTVQAATILFVPQGGTGFSSSSPLSILTTGSTGTSTLVASSTITVNAIRATSTTLTSAFQAEVGIGTTTPAKILSVSTTATTTIYFDSTSATQGTCIKMKNATGTAYTYMTVGYGVAIFSTDSCE